MAKLDHRHHAFIQSLMTRGPILAADAEAMFEALSAEALPGSHPGDFSQFVAAINKEMNFVQMQLRAGKNQYDGSLYYGLVNELGNEQAKMGTRYSAAQIAFFKAVLEAIVLDSSLKGEITGIQALNLRLEFQNEQQSTGEAATQTSVAPTTLTLAQKEKTLTELAHDQWLTQSDNGRVGLGVRSFLELWNVFKNFDVPSCDVCNEAGIKAQACKNEGCRVRIHDYCLEFKFRNPQVPRVCPKCGTRWECQPGSASQRERGSHTNSTSSQNPSPPILSSGLKRPRSTGSRRSAFSGQIGD